MSHDCLYPNVVFVAWSVHEYLFRIEKRVGWKGGIFSSPQFGSSYAGRRACGGIADAGENGTRLHFCSHSSGKQLRAMLARCLFWCKQGSAPGSSGVEL